jgi:hypothetical protein
MPQLVESCGMFFYPPYPSFSDFLEKNMPFYFVLSPICAIFAVSKIYADESTHSKYK